MSVFRVQKNKNYTIMSNYHIKDNKLSLKAKGLLSTMLSLPDDWDYSIKGLVNICKENETAIRSSLKELEECCYLERKKVKNEKGLFEYEYLIYEEPHPHIENPHVDNLHMDNPRAENQVQLNTNILNTNNKDKLDKQSINSITKELIRRNFINEIDLDLYNYNSFIDDLLRSHQYKDIVVAINYVIPQMKIRANIDNKLAYFKKSVINNIERIKKINLPSWLNEKVEFEKLSSDELKEIELLFKEFK